MKKIIFSTIILATIFIFTSIAHADITDCKNGYKFSPRSGVGCQQINCNDIPDAHYSYTGYCICGTSGSINEKDTDPNKACSYPSDYSSCPSCVYACVHKDEKCPNEDIVADQIPELDNPPATQIETPSTNPISGSANQPAMPTSNPQPTATPTVTTTNISSSGIIPTPDANTNPGMTCQKFCAKLTHGNVYDEILLAEGEYPNCKCTVDNKDDSNRITETVAQNGDTRTTYIYNPTTGELINKNTISIIAEKERIREMLGYKYDEDQIDQMLDSDIMEKWFSYQMQNITTQSNMWHAQFWWQHMVALWDHGYNNSTSFVDTYNFGRCGDSMMWLEQNLAKDLKLNGKRDKRSEAMLSITGEKYGNFINHTALIIRPTGYSNIEWQDTVQVLMDKTRKGGLSKLDLQGIDPKLLDAKVLDPYFKKTMTVREFIKGWSVIKIS